MRYLPGVQPVAKHLDETRREGHVEHRVKAGVPHVRVDEQHRPLDVCRDERVVRRDGRPAVPRARAREDEPLRLAGRHCCLDGEAERAKRLRRGRVGLDEEAAAHANALTAPGPPRAPCGRHGLALERLFELVDRVLLLATRFPVEPQGWNRCQNRMAECLLELVGLRKPVAEELDQERQRAVEDKPSTSAIATFRARCRETARARRGRLITVTIRSLAGAVWRMNALNASELRPQRAGRSGLALRSTIETGPRADLGRRPRSPAARASMRTGPRRRCRVALGSRDADGVRSPRAATSASRRPPLQRA